MRDRRKGNATRLPRFSKTTTLTGDFLQAPKEREQIGRFRAGEVALKLMAVHLEHFIQRGGAIVVEVRGALAYAAERRGIEAAVALRVFQAHVEDLRAGVCWRGMATGAL